MAFVPVIGRGCRIVLNSSTFSIYMQHATAFAESGLGGGEFIL